MPKLIDVLNGGQIRQMRSDMGFSQSDIAKRLGVSQAAVSQAENGNNPRLGSEILSLLEAEVRRLHGVRKIARAPISAARELGDYRGKPLVADESAYQALLAKHQPQWRLLALTRCASDTDLGYLIHESEESYGLVAFRIADGRLKIGKPIEFHRDYDRNVAAGLENFVAGRFTSTAPILRSLEDDLDEEDK